MYRSLLLDKFEHRGHFEGGRVETLFPLLKCYRTPKLQDFAHTISRWYSRTSASTLGAWTLTPISAWLTSVAHNLELST